MSDKKKKKRTKTQYYDDGRTIADMSGINGRKEFHTDDNNFVRPRSTLKDMFKTYIKTVKSMLVPMFITLGALTVVFFLAYLILGGFSQ
ncbi:MAG: hypothetical protein J6A96_06265 [Clostridia bacterium]|nr:hypothetical protein [Clostridia bacterium]